MRRSRSRPIRREPARRALAWALALLGAACLALTAAGLAVGARPLVVRTGSMAPQLPVGTVVLVRPEPARSARPGEIVAVVRADGRRILHRVRQTRPAGAAGAATIVLRGDRNRIADPPVTVRRIERPLLAVPAVGRPLTWLGGRWTQYWLGVLTGVLALAWLAHRRGRSGVSAA
ncbi:MAG TPA: S24/S26 family peptidase [Conexibacter sp.]|nr:S24/S26 family peptidase [Conexibacter sp.]